MSTSTYAREPSPPSDRRSPSPSLSSFRLQASIAESGAIAPLVKMVVRAVGVVGSGSATARGSVTARRTHAREAVEAATWAAAALATLADTSVGARVEIAQLGGLAPLVALAKSGEVSEQLAQQATCALCRLASDADNQLSITREGGLPAIIPQLVHGSVSRARWNRRLAQSAARRASSRTAADPSQVLAQEWAAAAIEALALDCVDNQNALTREGAIPPLVTLLGSDSDATQRYAAGALLSIAKGCRENLAAVVQPLVNLLDVRSPIPPRRLTRSSDPFTSPPRCLRMPHRCARQPRSRTRRSCLPRSPRAQSPAAP